MRRAALGAVRAAASRSGGPQTSGCRRACPAGCARHSVHGQQRRHIVRPGRLRGLLRCKPSPAQDRMSIHWSQAPRQAGMYSRHSGWGAGGSLNLPDRTGTSVFLIRTQHQVNRILCPNKKTSLKGTVVPATPGRKDCPIARSVRAPGHGPRRCGQAKAEIFQYAYAQIPPSVDSAFGSSVGRDTGLFPDLSLRPAKSSVLQPVRVTACGTRPANRIVAARAAPKAERNDSEGILRTSFSNGHPARRPSRKADPHPQNKAKPATGSALSAIVATAISPTPARSAPKRRGWRRSCSECRSGAASPYS